MSETKIFEISLPKIQSAFKQITDEANWETNIRMYWGYYFLDNNLQKIEQFSLALKGNGFEVVEMRRTDVDNLYLLHVEERVIHSAKSLFKQCHKLADHAIKNEIEFFDGWDVEKEKINKGLVE